MKHVYIVAIALAMALASRAETYLVNGKPATKVDAVKQLLQDPASNVLRCTEQILTEKMTLKAKPKIKKGTTQ